MPLTDVINHLSNFVLPALAVAIGMPLLSRTVAWGRRAQTSLTAQILLNFVSGIAALLAGLWFWGQDGRMATYLAMAVVCGATQWLVLRAWRN